MKQLIRRCSFIAFLVAFLASSIVVSIPVSAVSGSQFNAARIIDDVVFFSSNTMSSHEIKLFLNSKVPVCETNHPATNPSYQPPFICLKDYGQSTPFKPAEAGLCNSYPGGYLSAADIIYEVGKSCGINPQVLLVLLQKEQSLVTDTWPWPTQYRSATGYGCPDTAPCDAEYYGFFNQVYMAARQFRYYAKTPNSFGYKAGRNNNIQYNPSASCGASNVYIQNQATAGLYNYTPYQPNGAALNNLYGSGDSCSAYGNRNFWRMFNDWFGSPVIGAVPSPLYKSTSTGQIFVIAGGKKYLVTSPDIMVAYGLQRFQATEVPQSFIDQYATGATLTTIAKKESDASGVIFLFDDGKRYIIDINDCSKYPNGTANPTTTWAIDCFNSNVTKSVANEFIDIYTVQDIRLPKIIVNQNLVWQMEGGLKHMVTDPVFVDLAGGWGSTRWMKDINASQAQGKMFIPDMSLVKFDNNPVIYYLAASELHPIAGPDDIGSWGLGGRSTYVFPASYNATDPIPVGGAINSFAQDSANNRYLLLTTGAKVPLAGNTDFTPSGYSQMPDYTLNRLPTVSLSPVLRSSSGAIFTVNGGKRYPFPTGDDFYYSGYRPNQIQQVPQSAESLLTYGGMRLSPGRLFKVSGDETIRYVYGEGASLSVTSTTIPGLPYNKIITVDASTGSRYPLVGTYR